jgi:hypothetical protein
MSGGRDSLGLESKDQPALIVDDPNNMLKKWSQKRLGARVLHTIVDDYCSVPLTLLIALPVDGFHSLEGRFA